MKPDQLCGSGSSPEGHLHCRVHCIAETYGNKMYALAQNLSGLSKSRHQLPRAADVASDNENML